MLPKKLLEHGFLVIVNSRKIFKVDKAVIVPGGVTALALCNDMLSAIHILLDGQKLNGQLTE